MARLRSRCSAWLGLGLAAAIAGPGGASAQRSMEAVCDGDAECAVAEAAVRLIHPRVGLGLWGGSPVPGSASTLGMRIGSMPRISVAFRGIVVPMELPQLLDRDGGSARAYAPGLAAQATVGVLPGWSPAATVGGVLSLDVVARLGWLGLPSSDGFDGGAVGGFVGLRLGVLRESFTLPGVSITGSYGRSTSLRYGDATDDGYLSGAVGGWGLTAAASKRLGPVGLTAGTRYDRYTGEVDFSYRGARTPATADASTDAWSGFADLSWTYLIFHASVELGWQDTSVPDRLPAGVSPGTPGWWAGLAFRVSI